MPYLLPTCYCVPIPKHVTHSRLPNICAYEVGQAALVLCVLGAYEAVPVDRDVVNGTGGGNQQLLEIGQIGAFLLVGD